MHPRNFRSLELIILGLVLALVVLLGFPLVGSILSPPSPLSEPASESPLGEVRPSQPS